MYPASPLADHPRMTRHKPMQQMADGFYDSWPTTSTMYSKERVAAEVDHYAGESVAGNRDTSAAYDQRKLFRGESVNDVS